MAPGRTLSGIYRNSPLKWFDPTAFALPLAGTYGTVGRNVLIGPGLANHANFGIPSHVVLTTAGQPISSAGLITSTTTTSRQIQFGLN